MNVLVTGGNGFIGKALVRQLSLEGAASHIVSRNSKSSVSTSLITTPTAGELFTPELIAKVTKVVNLSGESIAGRRWNSKVKEQILNSRVAITRSIVESIRRNKEDGLPYPKVLVSASAVGYYGTHPSETFTEESKNGDDFLASVCRCWEEEALKANSLGVRVISLRFGHVLASDGGMLAKVALPFSFGMGGYLGDGEQWMSWIHRRDLIHIILQSLKDTTWQGIYNLTTPYPVRMKEFMEILGVVLGSKSRMNIPAFLAKMIFGEMAQDVLLKGQKVFPKRLLEQGYVFQYPHLNDALYDIYPKIKSF